MGNLAINLSCEHRGKVRELYTLPDDAMLPIPQDHLLMVASDRLSAYDHILPTPIPQKGEVLTALSCFWFERFTSIIPNHTSQYTLASLAPYISDDIASLAKRALIVQRTQPLKFEAVVRGYLVGSAWEDYQREQAVCGLRLPSKLRFAEKLPTPIFTPATKADLGSHDQNTSFTEMCNTVGTDIANKVRDCSLEIYKQACTYAASKGIIIADTKFEFGIDNNGTLLLIDEVLTPDSSRFWDAKTYTVGHSAKSFDKQFVRDYLTSIRWNKKPPAPSLPADIIEQTRQKYFHIQQLLLGNTPS